MTNAPNPETMVTRCKYRPVMIHRTVSSANRVGSISIVRQPTWNVIRIILRYAVQVSISPTFYEQLLHITVTKLVKNYNFLVKKGFFICKFGIWGPKWRNVSTSNNEGNLYMHLIWITRLLYSDTSSPSVYLKSTQKRQIIESCSYWFYFYQFYVDQKWSY